MCASEHGQPEALLIRAAGLRWTQQRRLILQTLRQAGGRHMTAEEVWRAVSVQHATLNRSTVYRSLEAALASNAALR